MSENNIYMKLAAVQTALNIPKDRVNDFAKKAFAYRNAEDILSAAKPICKEQGCVVYCTDDLVCVGKYNYIKAAAVFTDGVDKIVVYAYGRENESRSGFDPSQLTGSASSYARKYALNGLFALDDGKDDPDSMNNNPPQNQQTPQAAQPIICPRCGMPVKGITGNSGKHYTAEQIFNKYGMCAECHLQARAQAQAQQQAPQNGG